MVRFKRRQIVFVVLCLTCILILRSVQSTILSFGLVQLYHLRYNLHHKLYALGIASLITKGPILQIVNDESVDIVFEIRQDPARFFQAGASKEQQDAGVQVHYSVTKSSGHVTDRHVTATMRHDEREVFVYRARLTGVYIAEDALQYTIHIGSYTSTQYICDSLARVTKGDVIRIGVLGDNQFAAVQFSKLIRQLEKVGAKTARGRSRHGHGLDALIHVGDAVQDAASPRAWQTDFFDPLHHHDFLSLPVALLRGNHDSPSVYSSSPQPIESDDNVDGTTATNDGGLIGGRNSVPGYTSFSIHSVFFVVLDSNTDSELQDRYLRASLLSPPSLRASRRVVLVHIPPFVEYWDPTPWRSGENLWGAFVRTRYVPIFEELNVDLVLSGHQHNYQRAQKAGVTYIITGGAGGTLDREVVETYGINLVTRITHHFGVLEIGDGRDLMWRMYLPDGTIGDEVIL